jgi:hypothetical protein
VPASQHDGRVGAFVVCGLCCTTFAETGGYQACFIGFASELGAEEVQAAKAYASSCTT